MMTKEELEKKVLSLETSLEESRSAFRSMASQSEMTLKVCGELREDIHSIKMALEQVRARLGSAPNYAAGISRK